MEKEQPESQKDQQQQQDQKKAGSSITEFISGLAKIGQEKQGIRYSVQTPPEIHHGAAAARA